MTNIKELKQRALAGDLAALQELRQLGLLSGNKSKYRMAPVSYAQRRLWFIDKMDQSPAYNLPAALILDGNLHVEALENAFREIINRHEILRTSFVETDGIPYQKIVDQLDFKLPVIDLTAQADKDAMISKLTEEESNRSFDLSEGPLMVCQLLKLEEGKHLLLFNMHHIISDGWSVGVLIDELTLLYNSFSKGQASPLEPLKVQYKDYARKHELMLKNKSSESHKNYWINKFSGEMPFTGLPSDLKRPAYKTFNGRLYEIEIDRSLYNSLKKISRETNVSLFMFVVSAVNVLLGKYSGKNDIIIGTPVSGREQQDLENQIGFYVNTILLRNEINASVSFRSFLEKVKANCLEVFDHQMYPFDLLVEDLNLERDTSRNPLFEIVISLQDLNADAFLFDGIKTTVIKPEIKFSKMDLHFNFEASEEEMKLGLIYNPDIFSNQWIVRFGNHFVQLLKNLLNDPDKAVGNIEFITDAEKVQIVHEFNDTSCYYPKEKTIAALFEEMAESFPDKAAVVYRGIPLTYRQLNAKANVLARMLKCDYDLKQDEPVVILIDRSHELIIAILAALKAGGAYLPIDAKMPAGRIETILKDAAARILLTEPGQDMATNASYQVIPVTAELFENTADYANMQSGKTSSNLAYILYTSGSTGRPKGSMIEEKSVIRLVRNTNYCCFSDTERIFSTSSVSFDATTLDIWGALLNGGTLYLENTDDYLDPEKLGHYLSEYQISLMLMTTGLFSRMLEADQQCQLNMFENLRILLVGGDKMLVQSANKFNEKYPGVSLLNAYGPTENTTITTIFPITGAFSDDIPIGKPISNTTVYILNETGNLCPTGIPGELCTGGEGVSRGYVNRPDLNKKCFIDHPFCKGEKLYRTGDMAQWTADGNILFLGRTDDQLKIRGFRIETGEVEACALQYDGISDARILVLHEEDQKQMVLYYVAAEELTPDMVKSFVGKLLPDYMIPGYFVRMTEFPLNQNGKVDLKAFPKPELGIEHLEKLNVPSGQTEKTLAKIFCNLLNINSISVKDNFFSKGGHSLKAIKAVSAIQKELAVKVSLKEFFAGADISSLSQLITGKKRELLGEIPVVEKADHYELSSAQKRLWVLDKVEQLKSTYNIPLAVTLFDQIDVSALQSVFNDMLLRHESLRTVFIERNGVPFQKIIEGKPVPVTITDFTQENDPDRAAFEYVVAEAHRPFNLSEFPLVRLSLIKTSPEKQILFINIHHIICDGWSVAIMEEELFEGYRKRVNKEIRPVGMPSIQYKDYTYWQNSKITDSESSADRDYWLRKLGGEISPLDIPADFRRPAVKTYAGDSLCFSFPEEFKKRLDEFNAAKRSSLFITLTTAIKVLLHRYTGKEDIIVGTPVAGRNHPDLEDQVGYYANTLALRDLVQAQKTFAEFLEEVKETATDGYSHQMYPFDKLIDDLKLSRDTSHSPLFDVMIVMQNTGQIYPGAFKRIEPLHIPMNISKFDLTFNFNDNGKKLDVLIEYNTQLYKQERIEQMYSHLLVLLREVMDYPAQSIQTVNILSEKEKENLLVHFNDTQASYPAGKTVVELFKETVKMYPSNTATVYKDTRLSYSELDEWSDAVAGYIGKHINVKPGEPVGVMVPPSASMVAVLLGILKTGAAYVPVDPEYPDERIGYILSESKIRLFLAYPEEIERLTRIFSDFSTECRILNLTDLSPDHKKDKIDLNGSLSPDASAYIIFTSGSTGKPKGCPITHRNLVRLFINDRSYFKFGASDVWIMAHSYCFDFSVWEMYGALLFGGKLVIPDRNQVRDIPAFVNMVSEHGVTVLNQTPGAFYKFIDTVLKAKFLQPLLLRYVIFGGDKLDPSKLAGWIQVYPAEKVRLVNMYGITETTIHVTYHRLTDQEILASDGSSNIGVPLPETKVYILDAARQLVPVGVYGEIHVAGTGLSKGYLNRPDLTEERFIPNPYNNNEKLYKSGDVGRWLYDGTMEYLNRIDNQVQIRGFRVEAAEIELKLRQHPEITDSVVLAVDREGTKELAAYIVTSAALKINELKSFLSATLPDYMIPSWFIQTDKIPLTSNGKLDKKALPPVVQNIATGAVFENPVTRVEADLLELWQEVLSAEQIGIHDNFFDLGGNSILLVKLHDRISKQFPDTLELIDLFSKSNIAEQAAFISQKTDKTGEAAPGKEKQSAHLTNDIAVIGIASRIGLSETPDDFWDKLCRGVDFIGPIPEARIPDIQKLAGLHQVAAGSLKFREYCYLPEVDKFDPGFFKLSPGEASFIDPGQRLFMETAYHALEDAGYGGNKLWGSHTGIFIGASDNLSEYSKFIENSQNPDPNVLLVTQTPSILSSRLSYHLNLKGPALLVDTACSSSLVALHLACQSIREGKIDSAIVGGVKLHLLPFDSGARLEIDSSDGRAHCFDDSSDGTGGGEGVVAIFIKSLEKAKNDKDYIYAVIKGSEVNQDGNSNGITAPDAEAQADVIDRAWQNAGIDPCTVSFIETHGTGTKLGDPVEIAGIAKAFGKYTSGKGFCAIGAVKANIGHLDTVAGLAGLLKAILSLNHKKITPLVHFNTPNRNINFGESGVYINRELKDWTANGIPRRCGVSSFGLSGTNCHVVLEEAPDIEPKAFHPKGKHIFVLSSRSREGLLEYIRRMRDYLRLNTGLHPENVCYTLATGRGHYAHRLAVLYEKHEELIQKLSQLIEQNLSVSPEEDMFYQFLKVVPPNKKEQVPDEITEIEIRYRSENINALIRQNDATPDQIAKAYVNGVTVDWANYFPASSPSKVSLPVYPFEKKRCWVQLPDQKSVFRSSDSFLYGKNSTGILLNKCLFDTPSLAVYSLVLNAETWLLKEHRVMGNLTLVGVAYLQIAFEVGKNHFNSDQLHFDDFYLLQPLVVYDNEELEVLVSVNKTAGEALTVNVHAKMPDNRWKEYAGFRITNAGINLVNTIDIQAIKSKMTHSREIISGEESRLDETVQVSKKWNCLKKISWNEKEYLAELCVPDEDVTLAEEFYLYPPLIDAALSFAIDEPGFLPYSFGRVQVRKKTGSRIFSYIRQNRQESAETRTFDVTLADEKGNVMLDFGNFTLKKATVLSTGLFHELVWKAWSLSKSVQQKTGSLAVLFDDTCNPEVIRAFRAVNEISVCEIAANNFPEILATIKPQKLIYLLSETTLEDNDIELLLQKSLYRVFNFAKALAGSSPVDILFVGKNTCEVTGKELYLNALNYAVAGLAQVVQQENPDIRCRFLDIDEHTTVPEIVNELNDGFAESYYYRAIREGKWFIREIRPVQPEDKRGQVADGTYIITGGTGGIGLELAHYLAQKANVKLALLSRSAFPSRHKWQDLLHQKDNERLCHKIQKIQKIENDNAEIHFYAVDVADYEHLAKTIATIWRELGEIRGVFHTAGLPGNGFIFNKNLDTFREVIRPKIQGTVYLSKLLRKDKLDFFIMTSALTAIVPTSGQSDYTAANSFMDAWSYELKKAGVNAMSINLTSWKETGMAFETGLADDGIFKSILTQEGIDAIDRLLSSGKTSVILGETDLRYLDTTAGLPFYYENEAVAPPKKQKVDAEIPGQVTLLGRKDGNYSAYERTVGQIWGSVLGYAEMNVSDNYYDLGGDSIHAIKIKGLLEKQNFKVIISDLFNYLTIADLAVFLESKSENALPAQSGNIQPIEKQEYYPVSPAQRRLFILDQLSNDRLSYHLPQIWNIKGKLDPVALVAAFTRLTDRHEILRTSFDFVQDAPVQIVHEKPAFAIPVLKMTEEQCRDYIRGFVQPFDLKAAPLFRIEIIELTPENHLVLFDAHHIILDAFSMEILKKEVLGFYEGKTLNPLRVQYKDYAVWQNNLLAQPEVKKQKEWWISQFKKEIPVINLPVDYPRTAIQSSEAGVFSFSIDEDLTASIKKLSAGQGISTFMILFAVYQIVMHKYTNQEDIVIGITTTGRNSDTLSGLLGMFVNNLPVRAFPKGEHFIFDFLKEIRETVVSAFANQDYPFDELVENLDIKPDLSRSPIFDVVFSYMNFEISKIGNNDLQIEDYKAETVFSSEYDLMLYGLEAEYKIYISIKYKKPLFRQKTIERFAEHFRNTVEFITRCSPTVKISDVEFMSKTEIGQLEAFNRQYDPVSLQPDELTLLENSFAVNWNKTAVYCNDKTLTYRELNEKANQLANYLRTKQSVKFGDLIGIMLERNESMVVAMLGVLKSGAAYVGIDPAYPKQRIDYILNNSKAKILITSREVTVPEGISGIRLIDIDDRVIEACSLQEPVRINTPGDLAYVIYTSGSTGQPKGVAITRKNLSVFLQWAANEFQSTAFDIVYAVTSYCFDLSVFEIFYPLVAGKTIRVLGSAMDIPAWLRKDNRVLINTVPSLLEAIREELNTIGFERVAAINLAGESIPQALIDGLDCDRMEVRNLYGPSEDTTYSTVYWFSNQNRRVLIGKPVANTQIYITDIHLKLVPPGHPGEICIAGDGLAQGYLYRDELTAEKFIRNPFGTGRLYLTGDLGRWTESGDIEYLGRIDRQVKIRGFRIELGEIETNIRKYPNVENAVAVAFEKNGTKEIAAYLVLKSEIDMTDLKNYLKKLMPAYMIPLYFVTMDQIPLTSNGKIDVKALPRPDWETGRMNAESISPESLSPEEETLAAIWKDILGISQLSRNDSFFDLGGHSLKALKLISQINRSFNRNFALSAVFEYPSVAQFAAFIGTQNDRKIQPLVPLPKAGYYDVSHAQRRMWTFDRIEKISVAYNIPMVFSIQSELDIKALQAAFDALVRKYESLRTYFIEVDGDPKQVVLEEVGCSINVVDVVVELKHDLVADCGAFIRKAITTPFNLKEAPLMKVTLLKHHLNPEYILIINIHHIVLDEWSMDILIRNLALFYDHFSGRELIHDEQLFAPSAIQYKEFAQWQNRLIASSGEQKEYWLEKFKEPAPTLDLPADYQRPKVKTFEGKTEVFTLPADISEGLRKLSSRNNASLFMTTLALLNVLFAKYSNQNDIVIGTPVANREHPDIQDHIGFFLNTLALRNKVDPSENFTTFLDRVRKNTIEAFDRQLYPFDLLVDDLLTPRNLSYSPLFDVMLISQSPAANDNSRAGLTMKPVEYEYTMSKFDLSVSYYDNGIQIRYYFEYNTSLFKPERIRRMFAHLSSLIASVLKNEREIISRLVLSSDEEKVEILALSQGKSQELVNQSVVTLIEKQVAANPEQPAIAYKHKKLNYNELNVKANQLAGLLIEKGVNPGDFIGVMDRTEWSVIALLAILKAGGVYVPIDPNYPKSRIHYILADSRCKLLITSEKKEKLDVIDPDIVFETGELESMIAGFSKENLPVCTLAESGANAYVIYTSGSTGQPKGILGTHKCLLNLIEWQSEKMEGGLKTLQFAPHSFDVSVQEMLFSLSTGGTLYLIENETRYKMSVIAELIERESVEILTMPYSALNLFLGEVEDFQQLKSLKHLITSGEQPYMNSALTKLLKEFPNLQFHNQYGPSETHVVTSFSISGEPHGISPKISAGRPINNTQIILLDKDMQLVPVGIPGELCIGGYNVANGYLNKSDLTDDRFIKNPFGEGKLYKSGDWARWGWDGALEFLGRDDGQVKVRGFRIEIGEIETCLLKYPDVKEVAVKLTGEEDAKEIAAYLTTSAEIDVTGLRDFILMQIPAYMVPAYFVVLDAFPRTPSGKTDLRSLPEPTDQNNISLSGYMEPEGEAEMVIAQVWKEILNKEKVGVNDNFFEIGGNSIKAIQLMSKVQKRLGRKTYLNLIFEQPTIRKMAQVILNTDEWLKSLGADYILIHPGQKKMVFFMPPGIGYSFAYLEYARYFPGYTICALNFIESQQPEKSMADILTSLQSDGEFYLFGHSAGGNMAYDVAIELRKRGKVAGGIVLLDSYRQLEVIDWSEEEYLNDAILYIEQNHADFLDEEIREAALRKIVAYRRYLNARAELEPVGCPIIQIEANDEITALGRKISRTAWGQLTSQFEVHKGFGGHMEMLNPVNLEKNAQLTNQIINRLQNKPAQDEELK